MAKLRPRGRDDAGLLVGALHVRHLDASPQTVTTEYTDADGINDAIEGAVISRAEVVDGWTRLYLVDGRALIFADCECFAVVFSKDILQ